MNIENQSQNINKIKLCLLLASSLTILASASLTPALPKMSEFFRSILGDPLSAEFWAKLIIAVPGLSIALAAPLVGIIADKMAKKTLLLLSLFLYFLTGVGAWWVYSSVELLFVSRLLLGLAVAGVMVAVTTLAAEYFQGPALAKYMGLQAAFGSFGGVLFLALGGVLADIHWTYVFWVYAVSALLIPAVFIFVRSSASLNQGAVHVPAQNDLLGNGIIVCCLLAFAEVFILYLIPLQYPFLAQRLGGASSTEIGLSLAAIFMLLAFVSMQYHRIKRNFSYFSIQALGYLIITLGFSLTGFTENYAFAFSGMLLSAVGFGIIRPNLMMYLFSFISVFQRGKAMGIITSFFFLAQFCSPLLLQPLVEEFGISLIFCIFSGVSLLITCALLVSEYFTRSKVGKLALES